jgi:hypothetical protein
MTPELSTEPGDRDILVAVELGGGHRHVSRISWMTHELVSEADVDAGFDLDLRGDSDGDDSQYPVWPPAPPVDRTLAARPAQRFCSVGGLFVPRAACPAR